MSFSARFPNALDRIKGVFKHFDTALGAYFTPLREEEFAKAYVALVKEYSEKTIDESLKVKWNKGTAEWRVAVRAYSLAYLIDLAGRQDKIKLRSAVKTGREEIDGLSKKSVIEIDKITKSLLETIGPYKKFDKKITEGLRKYLEKPFVQDPHIELLVSQKALSDDSEAYKGICMGFVVRWVAYQILHSGKKKTGTRTLEREAVQALDIEKSHIEHGKKVTTGKELMKQLQQLDEDVRLQKTKPKKIEAMQRFDQLALRQTAELTVETIDLTLKKHGLVLQMDGVSAQSFRSVSDYNETWENFKYSRNGKPLAEFICKLKAPAYFILSIKWAGDYSTEKGAHVWAGALTDGGLRLFDPNMGTFFTNTEKAELVQAMYDKWTDEDRPINVCVYLPVTLG